MVGVNKFINENEIIDSGTFLKTVQRQITAIKIFKENRDYKIVRKSLEELVNIAKTNKTSCHKL